MTWGLRFPVRVLLNYFLTLFGKRTGGDESRMSALWLAEARGAGGKLCVDFQRSRQRGPSLDPQTTNAGGTASFHIHGADQDLLLRMSRKYNPERRVGLRGRGQGEGRQAWAGLQLGSPGGLDRLGQVISTDNTINPAGSLHICDFPDFPAGSSLPPGRLPAEPRTETLAGDQGHVAPNTSQEPAPR